MELYDFQKKGIEWIKSKNRCILADDMGLGKSVQSIMGRRNDSLLVICPSSVKSNWAHEIKQWSTLTPKICRGLNSITWPNPGEAIIANYELVQDFMFQPSHPVTVIYDEIHTLRNSGSNKYRNSKYLSYRAGACSQLIGLTGSPLSNRESDVANILDVVGLLDGFGGKRGFAATLGGKLGKRGDMRGCIVNKEFSKMLASVMLRREKEDVLPDLPTKVFSVHLVDTWSNSLNTLMDEGLTVLNAYQAMAGDPGAMPPFNELSRVRAEMAREKIPHSIELVDSILDTQDQVVLFSAHKPPIEALMDRPDWVKIDGDVSSKKRQDNVDSFTKGNARGIGVTVQSGACGINLQCANHVVFNDLDYNLSNNIQAIDRIHRIGSKHTHCHYKFVTLGHGLDKRIGQILSRKQELFHSFFDEISVRN